MKSAVIKVGLTALVTLVVVAALVIGQESSTTKHPATTTKVPHKDGSTTTKAANHKDGSTTTKAANHKDGSTTTKAANHKDGSTTTKTPHLGSTTTSKSHGSSTTKSSATNKDGTTSTTEVPHKNGTSTTQSADHKDGSSTTKLPGHSKNGTTTVAPKEAPASTTLPPKKASNGGGGLNKLINMTITDEKIRVKVRHIFNKIPSSEEDKKKLTNAFKKLGVKLSKHRGLFTWIGTAWDSTFNAIGRIIIPSHYTTTSTTTTAKPATTSVAPLASTHTKAPGDSCEPCCSSRLNAVCFIPECPRVPSDKSKCADFPLCYPPCKLEIRDPKNRTISDDDDDDGYDDDDDDGYDDDFDDNDDDFDDDDVDDKKHNRNDTVGKGASKNATLKGVRYFDKIMKRDLKNETISKTLTEVFNSLHEKLSDDLMADAVDVFKYFKDNSITKMKPDSGQVLKGILGHIMRGALRRRGKATGKQNAAGSSRSEKLFSMNWSSEASLQLRRRRRAISLKGNKPFCPPCKGRCLQNASMCNRGLSCPNNGDCLRGQCVCKV